MRSGVWIALALAGCAGAAKRPLPVGLGRPDHGEMIRVEITERPFTPDGATLTIPCTIANRAQQPVHRLRYVSGYFDGQHEPTPEQLVLAERQLAIDLAAGETKSVMLVAGDPIMASHQSTCFGVRAVPVTLGDRTLSSAEAWAGEH